MFYRFIARRLAMFVLSTSAWLFAAGMVGYLTIGDSMFRHINSVWTALTARVHAAADNSRLSGLESSIGNSGVALRRLEQTPTRWRTSSSSWKTGSRGWRIGGAERRRLREALDVRSGSASVDERELTTEILDACRQGQRN